MSKLDELIKEYCPDGVEYKRFDEACTLHARIGWQRLTKAEYRDSGDYMLITGTDFTSIHTVDYNTCVYVSKERYEQDAKIQIKEGDILITKDGTLGKVAQVTNLPMPATLNGGVFVVRCKDDSLENRFILHFLLSGHFQKVVDQQKTGSTISHLTQGLFSRLLLPVPPLEVQREIVRVLDKFTLLTAELTAELTARKKQYEYYRNELLTFDNNIEFKALHETCEMKAGKAIPSVEISAEQSKDYKYECFGGNGIRGYVNVSSHSGEYPIIGRQGALCGNVNYASGDFYATEHAVVVQSKGDYTQRFLFHLLTHMNLNQYKSAGAQPGLAVKNLQELVAPVPSIEIQNRIVKVLDDFDSICSDLNIGLPAEINARQKQYEYYRDALLTFVEKGETILTEQNRTEQNRTEQNRTESN